MSTRPAGLLLLLAALVPVGLLAAEHGDARNPGVIPPQASFRGLTYGEWAAAWWQATFATPGEGANHPLSTGGAIEGREGVVFLIGSPRPAGSPRVSLTATIPSGTPLFLPVITAECSVYEDPPFHGDDEPSLRTCATGLVDFVSDVSVNIDGRPVTAHRVASPLFEWGPLPAANYFAAPTGTTSDSVADGYFVMVPPLGVGVHRIQGTASVAAFGLEVDAEWVITVEPRVAFTAQPTAGQRIGRQW